MKKTAQPLSDDARDVLRRAEVREHVVYLPAGQLERALWSEVNEALERLGGKWKSGKVKGHVFASDPTTDLAELLATGVIPEKNPTAFFETPPSVIDQLFYETLFYELDGRNGEHLRLLEPSAGKGAIARALRDRDFPWKDGNQWTIDTCELNWQLARALANDGFAVVGSDFLSYTPRLPYDAVVMNPPFAVGSDRLSYVAHVRHAWDVLAPGGILAAVVPAGLVFSEVKAVKDLRARVEEYGAIRAIVPPRAFHASGTDVATVLVTMHKPAMADSAPAPVSVATETAQATLW